MTALAKARRNPPRTLTAIRRVLADGAKAFEGGLACLDLSDGTLVEGQTGTGLLPIGHFRGVPEAGIEGNGTTTFVEVQLPKEIEAYWYANAAAPNAVDDEDVGGMCYILDDQTVTADATGRSVAGRVWEVHPTRGVLVEPAIALGPVGPQGPQGGPG